MTVFNTQIHIITFLVILVEVAFLFHQTINYLSRPSDKNRMYYLIFLFLLIQHNLLCGLFPDTQFHIPVMVQITMSYAAAFGFGMFIPYFFYKAFHLDKLKFYAYWGSATFLLLPYIFLFLVPYWITKDFEFSRKLAVIVPFIYTIILLRAFKQAIKTRNEKNVDVVSKQEIYGMYISVILFFFMPVIAFFETELNILLEPILNYKNGSQVVAVFPTNIAFLITTVLFVSQSVRQSKSEYRRLQESEKKLQELNSELLEKVKERTHELELANELRQNAFINLAHETKTPLVLINNYLEDYIESHGQTKELKIIKGSVEKLTKDIVDVFDLERMKKGFNVYDNDQISDFSAILNQSLELFKHYSIKKNIEIKSFVEVQLLVQADPGGLFRIVNNLIENAIRYTGTGGKIQVDLRALNGKINFSVKDNGIGIPVELHEKIFDPYYQINSEKRNFQGMGLGLNIVKKFIESLNANIVINSDPSQKSGTEISIQFSQYKFSEFNKAEITNFKNSKVFVDIAQLEIQDRLDKEGVPTILIVEDNIQLLNYMAEKLEKKYNICVALSGSEAQEKLKSIKKLNLIISDVMMDNGDGFELYNSITSNKRLKHIPFIFITAKTNNEDKLQGLALGAVDYIYKPFIINELIAKIDSILNNLSNQRKAIIDNAYETLLMENRMPEQIEPLTPKPKFEETCEKYELTAREREIVKLIAKGNTHKEIANKLCIANTTVAKHVQNIFLKVSVNNKVELLNRLELSGTLN